MEGIGRGSWGRTGGWIVGTLLLFSWGFGCGSEPPQVYAVRGQIAAVAKGGNTLSVDHEEIPGFMEAMRMSFPMKDRDAARGLRPGDKVRLEIIVASGLAIVEKVEKLPEDTALSLAAPSGG